MLVYSMKNDDTLNALICFSMSLSSFILQDKEKNTFAA